MRRVAIALFLALLLVPAMAAAADFNVTAPGTSSYTINTSSNPTLTLTRGFTYTFAVNASGHPFWIKTVQGAGIANAYSTGVTNNGVQIGTLTFAVPANAPNPLFYNCELHAAMTGRINVVDPTGVQAMTWGRIKGLYH